MGTDDKMMRDMFIVKREGDRREFLCIECLDDDDIVLGTTVDVACDCCGYEDMEA